MTAQLDDFETALLHELRSHVSSPRRERRTRTRVLTGVGVAAAVGLLGALVVPGLGPTTAYSVQEGNSGEVTVSIDRLEDATGLERALAEHGIAADITYVPDGDECAPGRYRAVERSLSGMTTGVGADLLEVALPPGAVRDGETFVLAVSLVELPDTVEPNGIRNEDGTSVWIDFDVATGPVAPCEVVPGS